jgi:hypothetical protein
MIAAEIDLTCDESAPMCDEVTPSMRAAGDLGRNAGRRRSERLGRSKQEHRPV